MIKIGCHVSSAGGLEKTPAKAKLLGCECYQMFSRSPQGGKGVELTEELIKKFQQANQKNGFTDFYFHAPYYINLGSINPKIRHNSGRIILEELNRGDRLGAQFVITHVGSAKGWKNKVLALEKAIKILKEYLAKYQGQTLLLLENSAGAGEIIGDDFSELGEIISQVKSKKIGGICLDTQHSFASGWDWKQKDNFKAKLTLLREKLQGAKIRLLHINDSQTAYGSHKDRHAHLGEGQIGLEGIANWVAYAKEKKINLILETEQNKVMEDLKILKEMRRKND